jgi:hypothetical protein
MAFTTVPTYVTNQLITAAHANSYWRDNLNVLFPHTAIGDIAYADSTSTLAALAIGNTGHVIKSTGSAPVWDAIERLFPVRVIPKLVPLSVADGVESIYIPSELNGCNLVGVVAIVDTVSSSGTPTVQVRNVTDAVDMLSTPITIDANERTSYSAAAQPVIDTAHDDVATGDEIAIDIDVAGTGTKGLTVYLRFELP